MINSKNNRNKLKNESAARTRNEAAKDNLKAALIDDSAQTRQKVESTAGKSLHFHCECSNEDCDDRLKLSVSSYEKIHSDRKRFVVAPAHHDKAVEDVIKKHKTFTVVEKDVVPPENQRQFKPTTKN